MTGLIEFQCLLDYDYGRLLRTNSPSPQSKFREKEKMKQKNTMQKTTLIKDS